MTDPKTTAAIIAGGRARRFGGQDKCRLIVEGRSIIVRQVEILQRVADEVIIVVGSDPARFADLDLPMYPDRLPNAGAIGGLYTALDVAKGDPVLVVACDLPFLDARLLGRLVSMAGAADGAWVRGPRGVEPLLACYRREARARIRQQIDAGQLQLVALESVLEMAEIAEPELRTYGSPDRLLANINSPADYARVQYPPS